jgi:alpha-tubulin suppressor-like RCC1 family protein
VATVEVSPATPSIEVAESLQLSAIAKNSRGTIVSGHTASWTSSDPNVASVDSSGSITGLKGGTATITAQVDSITGTADVTVTDPVRTVVVSASTTTIEVTESVQLSAEPQDNGGNALTGRVVTWTSSDTSVATVDSTGLVESLQGGSATITAESEGVSGSLTIVVDNPPRSVEVTPNPASVDVGATIQLSATVRDLGGNDLTGYTPSWSTDDTAIATVDASGVVSGQSGGSTTINASVDDGTGTTVTGTASVDVGSPVAAVVVNPASVGLFPGEQAQTNVTLEDANGNTLTGRAVTWSSQDTAIATVDSNGLVDAVSSGSTTITAESEGVSGTVALEVLEWTQASAGDSYSCGVVSDGKGYCWGRNSTDGVLGDGTVDSGTDAAPNQDADKTEPTLIAGGIDFKMVAAGIFHTCGVSTSGQAYCWGSNGAGHLGDGSSSPSATPVMVSGSYTFTDIAPGANHACALEANGNLYCWGSNQRGQLGLGTGSQTFSNIPQRVPNLKFTSFSVGASHTCAISETAGDTYCWGAGDSGQIGDGDVLDRMAPTLVNSTEQFSVVAGGYNHNCAINASSDVYCWGTNDYGELGDGTTNPSSSPILADSSRTYTDLSLGAGSSCAIDSSADAYCWGFNGQGNLGTGTVVLSQSNPTLVSGGYSWILLGLGRQHACGLASGNADAYCWGDNEFGQVGNGTNLNNRTSPTKVLNP